MREFVTFLNGLLAVTPERVDPKDPSDTDKAAVVDVRTESEYALGHIAGMQQLSCGELAWDVPSSELQDLRKAHGGRVRPATWTR